jgi:hypothetical protein
MRVAHQKRGTPQRLGAAAPRVGLSLTGLVSRVDLVVDFKRCRMLSGDFVGSDRQYCFFRLFLWAAHRDFRCALPSISAICKKIGRLISNGYKPSSVHSV